MIRPIKLKSTSTLIKKIDDQVSLFVRMNAADETGTVSCISCDNRMWWKESDCAHFQHRADMGTRWMLKNLAPACIGCNRFNPDFHLEEWSKKMDEHTRLMLLMTAKSMVKFTKFELTELLEFWTKEVSRIKKEKGL